MTLWGVTVIFSFLAGMSLNFFTMIFHIIGIIWAVPAAFMCRRTARMNGLDGRQHAIRGALYSALNICLWFYFMRRIRGEDTYKPVVYLFFGCLLTDWLIASVVSSFLISEIQVFDPQLHLAEESTTPFIRALRISGVVSAVVWFATLIGLLSTQRRYKQPSQNEAMPQIQLRDAYLVPCVLAFVFITISATSFALLY